ncbi:hypothetical protein V6N13_044348 [Hibiscus sabdariffa]|uniref:Secreted protein n=1 Tax=Hibiscus sabdariffa TaxID=183260 RepID=A0ABR2RI96_9ROSI
MWLTSCSWRLLLVLDSLTATGAPDKKNVIQQLQVSGMWSMLKWGQLGNGEDWNLGNICLSCKVWFEQQHCRNKMEFEV